MSNGPRRRFGLLAGALLLSAGACGDVGPAGVQLSDPSCEEFASVVRNGGPGKDGIPALTNPTLVTPDDTEAAYLRPEDRVIGLLIDGEAIAVPLNIGWYHEIVNLDLGGRSLAVTHCPLTGSSMVFDRSTAGGAEFGVSGLLFQNNLIMYDRNSQESLWPQMGRAARCGALNGRQLTMVPAFESRWAAWVEAHPDTRVVSSETGYGPDYTLYPYGGYDRPTNEGLLFAMPIDPRRPPKERVLAIPAGLRGGIAYPFGELERLGDVGVVRHQFDGEGGAAQLTDAVVFWDAAARMAAAYRPVAGGRDLTFRMVDGQIRDDQTDSVWRTDGLAVSGSLQGQRLEGTGEAYVAFWFAWATFAPETEIWRAS